MKKIIVSFIFILLNLISSLSYLFAISFKISEIKEKIYVFPAYLINDALSFYENNNKIEQYIVSAKFENSSTKYLYSIFDKNEITLINYEYFIKSDSGYKIDLNEYKQNVQIAIKFNIYNLYKFDQYKVFMVK